MLYIHKINYKQLLTSLAISLGVGVLSGFLTMGSMQNFQIIAKPPLTPPGFLFPIVWFILFALMGISSYLVFNSPSTYKANALITYGIQLVVNFVWPLLFFNLEAYALSLVWILILLTLIIIMIIKFYKVNKFSAYLQIPYLLWVTFATYLNFGVWLLN